jgi:hypothetical protein
MAKKQRGSLLRAKLANVAASAAAAPPCPFTFSQSRSRAAVRLEAVVRPVGIVS